MTWLSLINFISEELSPNHLAASMHVKKALEPLYTMKESSGDTEHGHTFMPLKNFGDIKEDTDKLLTKKGWMPTESYRSAINGKPKSVKMYFHSNHPNSVVLHHHMAHDSMSIVEVKTK
jgi:hypothetical protein